MYFVAAMAMVAIIGFVITLPRLLEIGIETEALVDKCLDLITITVPPALPATMSVGVAFAITRLKKSKIFCISPPRVNVSGMIEIMVFDKTGTLTEDGLQVLGVKGVQGTIDQEYPSFTDFEDEIQKLLPDFKDPQDGLDGIQKNRALLLNESMACCHAIAEINGEPMGDPLEIKMFENTKWTLNESNDNTMIGGEDLVLAFVKPTNQLYKDLSLASSEHTNANLYSEQTNDNQPAGYELAIIKRFDFESKLQRMSVIVKSL